MSAKRYRVVVEGRTYEGTATQTPGERMDILHVRGPLEYHRRRQMHHAINLTEWRWVSAPIAPAAGTGTGRRREFVTAGWEMADQWSAERRAEAEAAPATAEGQD